MQKVPSKLLNLQAINPKRNMIFGLQKSIANEEFRKVHFDYVLYLYELCISLQNNKNP